MRPEEFSEKRKALVEQMQREGVLKNTLIKNAFLSVPREKFFPEKYVRLSYDNNAFPIGSGQTISQPSTIAVMLELLDLQEGQKILEVGAGSAYVMALLSSIVGKKGKVFGIELLPELKERAEKNLGKAKCGKNVELLVADGCKGWPQKKPFDRILISAACKKIPEELGEQLAEKGKIVAPLGGSFSQEIVMLQKEKGRILEKERKCCFVFVPLR